MVVDFTFVSFKFSPPVVLTSTTAAALVLTSDSSNDVSNNCIENYEISRYIGARENLIQLFQHRHPQNALLDRRR